MKKYLACLLVIGGFLFVGTQQACAQEKIERFDVDVTINQTGTVSIKETIYYDFSSLQKHGKR